MEHTRQRQKEFQLKVESIALSSRCDTKSLCYEEMEDWLGGIWSKVEIVGKCPKFLISEYSFL